MITNENLFLISRAVNRHQQIPERIFAIKNSLSVYWYVPTTQMLDI